MTDELNLRPMLEDPATDADLRTLLRVGQAHGPSDADLERLAKRLAPAVGLASLAIPDQALASTVAPANPLLVPKAAIASKGLFAKLTISGVTKIVATVSAVGAATFLMWPAPSPRTVETPKATPVIQQEAPKPVVTKQTPAEESVVEKPAAKAPKALENSRPRVSQKAPPVTPEKEPESELVMIRRAQELRSQPNAALSALSEHARVYPEGVLAQEREVLAIEALIAAGRRDDAEARAARMEKAYPSSAHLRRVRVLLGAPTPE